MVLESTIICLDNSDFMRNGDFLPTRIQNQQDAAQIIAQTKLRKHPENNVGLITMAKVEVLVTFTTDIGRLLARLHSVRPEAPELHFLTALRIAHLALKHRQGKNHKMRIVAFIGSPIIDEEAEIVKLAKRLKKEKVSVDIVNFGEESLNTDKLTVFINTLNGTLTASGAVNPSAAAPSSHLCTVPVGPQLTDALLSSPILLSTGEDGAPTGGGGAAGGVGAAGGFGAYDLGLGIDPNEDPELALALRVSLEEQRARQEEDNRRAQASSGGTSAPTGTIGISGASGLTAENVPIPSASEGEPEPAPNLAGSTGLGFAHGVDLSALSEEEQIAFAIQMSMQGAEGMPGEGSISSGTSPSSTARTEGGTGGEPMQVEGEGDSSIAAMIDDPSFLQAVLEQLPGVDPRAAIAEIEQLEQQRSQSQQRQQGHNESGSEDARPEKKAKRDDEKK